MRGVRQLLSGGGIEKKKKQCRITRIKVGTEGPELAVATQSTPGETVVSRWGGQHPCALVVDPGNPRYNTVFWCLAVGDFILEILLRDTGEEMP